MANPGGADPTMSSIEVAIHTMLPPSSSAANAIRGRIPFLTWALDRVWNPDCYDGIRMERLPTRLREEAWLSRRRHAPCTARTPKGAKVDCLYLRIPGEGHYVERLLAGTSDTNVSGYMGVSASLLFLDCSCVPYH